MADPIKDLLADLPPMMGGAPPGHVAILRSRVPPEQLVAADRWVKAHDGWVQHDPPHQSKSVGGGGGFARMQPVEPHYVVPAEALQG